MRKNPCRQLLRAAILAALAMHGGLAAADPQAIRYYEDAISRFNAGDFKGAEIQLKNALQRDPSQLPARVLMGRTQLELGDTRAAEEALLTANQLGVDPALTALPLAQARNRLGKHELVIEQLQPNQFPTGMQADLWGELGKARLASDDRVGAEIAFAEALRLEPTHAEALWGRARIALLDKDYTTAERIITTALSTSPEEAESWFLMGALYHARGEYGGAAAHFHQARNLDPNHYGATLGEATALLDDRKPSEAAPLLKRLYEERQGSLKVAYLYAQTLKALGREAEAQDVVRHASDLANAVTPADLAQEPEQLLLAALATFDNGEFERSHAFVNEYLAQTAGDARVSKQMAQLLLRMDRAIDASRLLTQLAATMPDDVDTLVLLGDANLQLHDYAGAERYYRAALEQLQEDPRLRSRVGLTQYRRGQTGQAIGTLERLVKEADKAPGPSLFLAVLYIQERKLHEARALVENARELQPQNLVAAHLLGVIAILQGDPVQGRRLLEETLAAAPRFRPAQLDLAQLDIREGRFPAAQQMLTELLQSDPEDIEVLHGLAKLAMAQGRRDEALQQLARIRQLDRRAQEPIIDLVRLHLADGAIDKAMGVAQGLALELPYSTAAKLALARVQLADGQRERARDTLQAAAKLATEDADTLFRVALLQADAADLPAAQTSLEGALARRPAWTEAKIQLAHLLFRQRQFDEAERQVAAILRDQPDHVQAITLQGDIRMLQGRPAEATDIYRQALQRSDLPDLAVRLYRAGAQAGQAPAALRELQAWYDAHPDQPTVMRLLGELHYQAGDLPAAQRLYQRLVELRPEDARAHNNLAVIYEASDKELALQSALRAHQLAPQDPMVLDTLGWLLVQAGELDRALKYLREAVVRDSRSPSIRYHLGVALAEYGKLADAKRELEQALALDPAFSAAEQARQRLLHLQGD